VDKKKYLGVINDILVDYVSESGELAGVAAANFTGRQRVEVSLNTDANFSYLVPQRLDLNAEDKATVFYFRSRRILENCSVIIKVDEREVFRKHYSHEGTFEK